MPSMPSSESVRTALGSRGVRTVRAAIASSLAVFVALGFHVVGGGSVPTPIVLVAALALALPAGLLLIGRSLSTVRLGAVVVAAQAVLHLLFSMGLTGSMIRSGADAHLSHSMQVSVPTMPMGDGGAGFALSGGSGLSSLMNGMTLAHILAAGITLLALRLGEDAFWSIVTRVAWELRRLLPHLRLVPQPLRRPSEIVDGAHEFRSQLVAWSALRRRGPPVLV